MFNYLKESFKRKRARRITQEYPAIVKSYDLEHDGTVEFANWDNPLLKPLKPTQTEINFFRKFIDKGDFVIDIGANIGDTTVPMGLAAGKTGTTLGFDPNPYVFKILEKNASLNRDKTNIIPVPFAISTEEDEFYFVSSEASFANGGISPTKESSHGKFVHPHKIKGVNLLEFLKKNYNQLLDQLSFIKIDTEGYDKEILKSIANLIEERRPKMIAESFGNSSDAAKKELFSVIKSHDYSVFQFENFRVGTEINELKKEEDMLAWNKTINLYALPN